MKPQTIKVGNKTEFAIVLEDDAQTLSDDKK